MSYKNKENTSYNQIFGSCAKLFAYSVFSIAFIAVQFAAIEALIRFTDTVDDFRCLALRSLIILSAFFYTRSHMICRSYNARKAQQFNNGSFKYQRRAVENFFAGLAFFIICIIILAPSVLKIISH